MKASVLLLLVLCASLVHKTKAGWFSVVTDAVGSVGRFVANNCAVSFPPSISCNINGRKRRQMETGTKDETLKALDKECAKLNLSFDMKMKEAVENAFREADKNRDGQLDAKESAMFQEILMVLTYCSDKKNSPSP